MGIAALLKTLKKDHYPRLPRADANVRLARLEAAAGAQLPPDIRAFYRAMDGVALFERDDPAYRLLPIARVERVSRAITGDDDSICPPSWYAFCDAGDGNYVALDLSSVKGDRCRVLDVFHETPADAETIATSFTEFLAKALKSGNEHYWLGSEAAPAAARKAIPKRTVRASVNDAAATRIADALSKKLAVERIDLSSTVEKRGKKPPRLTWDVRFLFRSFPLAREEVHPSMWLELPLSLRDWRKLDGVVIDQASLPRAAVEYHPGSSTVRLACHALRIELVRRGGAKFDVRYDMLLALPAGRTVRLRGVKRTAFDGLALENRLVPRLKDEAAVRALAAKYVDVHAFGAVELHPEWFASVLAPI